MLFPWKVVHSSLFFGCPLGLGLKEWSLNTGSCKVPGEAGKCRARRRTEAEVGFDPSGRQIMRGLTWVKWRKKWERKIDAVDAYWNNKWLSVTFSAADGTACSQGMLQKARSSWNCKSLGGSSRGVGCGCRAGEVGSVLLQTTNEWQNLPSELIKAPSRELMTYTTASKRKFFHSRDCTLDHTGLYKHIAFSKMPCSSKDVVQIGVCKIINPCIYLLRIFYELRGPLGARGWILIKIPGFLE